MNKINYYIFIDILKTFEYCYVHIYTYLQISLGVRFSALNASNGCMNMYLIDVTN